MKRTIKQNVYGNWHGYEGGRKVELFLGNTWEQEQEAREWLAGMRAVECRRDGCPHVMHEQTAHLSWLSCHAHARRWDAAHHCRQLHRSTTIHQRCR